MRLFLSGHGRMYSAEQRKHIRRILCVLFLFLVFCSIVFQIELQYTMKAEMKLYEKMQKESTKKEVCTLLREISCFPVREDETGHETYFFDNGYGTARTFGGKRSHEGIDIMTSNNRPGYFRIQSVCDGVIENIGWLKLGGYRIGIRSESGYYYYYAHLDRYAKGMAEGKKVSAGEMIGYMGNTGYGKEGTRGKFDVHLHFGIYRPEKKAEETLNPYYLLKYFSE